MGEHVNREISHTDHGEPARGVTIHIPDRHILGTILLRTLYTTTPLLAAGPTLNGYKSNSSVNRRTLLLKHIPHCHDIALPKG